MKLTEHRDAIIEAYRNGANLKQISEVYNVTINTVRNLLVSANQPRRPRGRIPKVKDQGRKLDVDSLPKYDSASEGSESPVVAVSPSTDSSLRAPLSE